MNDKYYYSKEFEDEVRKTLILAQQDGRIKINEWRNFIDYDIIPLIIKMVEIAEKGEGK